MTSRIYFSPIARLTFTIPVSRYMLDIEMRTHSLRLINRVEPIQSDFPHVMPQRHSIGRSYLLIPYFRAG